MSIEHRNHHLTTTDRDGDRLTLHRLASGGVAVQKGSNVPVYIENDDVLEVAEFLKSSHKEQVECDKCRGKGKVLG